ncbi:MAG: 2-oxoacid:acceptor oxidoreductase subunit alpha [Deltaproteobacteria bacterium]
MPLTDMHIMIGGEAGQGLVTIGRLLSKAFTRMGWHILVTQDYMSRIRGGHNTFSIRVGVEAPLAPRQEIDILVALNAETVELHRKDLGAGGILLADSGFAPVGDGVIPVPFEDLGPRKMENTVALGVIGDLVDIDAEVLRRLIRETFQRKHPEVIDENLTTLSAAIAWARGIRPATWDGLSRPIGPEAKRMMIDGNEAIALGALSAGCRFCAFYPMTPSTSIPLTLIAHGDAMGVVVEQAEDEIAAINMAIGASFTGAPSMVATSGGGFALMTEGVSLAGMTETPVVIVVAQRPGPATGLPTRTEQADLEFVLHAGHGEFPRAVFAPGDPITCHDLTVRAFHLAERFQGPVFLLTDQYLADSLRDVPLFDASNADPVVPGVEDADVSVPYRRFAVTDSGVSPRLLPGKGPHLVVADSDEHTEDGHITEDLQVRTKMVEKRLRKLCGIFSEVVAPVYEGEERPDLLLVAWGSSAGAVREAAFHLRREGRSVATLVFHQVWPLDPSQFLSRLEEAGEVVAVEGNATGQFARLIRRETGFAIKKLVLRYDGLPFTASYILSRI